MNKSKADVRHIKRQIQKNESTGKKKPAYQVPEPAVVVDESQFRPQPLAKPKTNIIIAWAVFAAALVVYLLTQARTTSFWDSGEYATCISILGVPHPPGNPFYILFGRALVALFGGIFSHAWIAAFISGLTSAFAVMFTYLITVQLASMFKIKDREAIFAGLMSALLTAFSFTFWMNAVEAEVYSGLVFFVNFIIWLTLWWVQHSRDFHHQNVLLLIVYLFFLGFCVHQTALQIAPAILFIVVYPLLVKGVKNGNFWYKFFGYGAALILSYLIFGAIGKSSGVDSLDQIGLMICIIALMMVELRQVFDRRLWLLGLALVAIGVSAHLYIPIRSADKPFINLGDPSTPQLFKDYIQRKQYKPEEQTSMFDRRGSFFKHQLGFHFFRYFGWQWFKTDSVRRAVKIPDIVVNVFGGLFVAFLGLFGAVFHFRKNKHSFYYMLAIMFCVTLLMVFVMNLSDEEVRDRDYFFVVAYNMWAIWMGIGALGLLSLFKSKALRIAVASLMLLLPVLNLAVQYREHDRSREFIALDYGVNFLNSVEENAIIFTNGDNDTYPLWFAQAVKDPYAKEFRHPARDVFPTEASQAAISQAMDYKNKQLKGIRKDVTIANLSLLNTSWYIRQLREREGVIISWSDEEILSLDDRRGSFQQYLWQDSVTYNAGDPGGAMNFSINYLENLRDSETTGAFYPRRGSDFAVLQIVKENFGKRPIYFAVTCESNVGFDDYLRNEGMVSRITHIKSETGEENIDPGRLLANIDEIYQYRSIDDENVHKDDNMQRLVMNYGSGFARAALYFSRQGKFDQALAYMEKARRFIDNELRLTEFWVNYYAGTQQLDKLDSFIDKTILTHADAIRIYNSYVLNTLATEFPSLFPRYMEKLLLAFPNEIDIAQLAYYYGYRYDLLPQVEQLLFDLAAENKLGYNQQDLENYLGAGEQEAPADSS
ncbi:MAG: DUF2723 domain-containing protein [Candidatus Cloacimonetes bacterium]|nr:DUF2723 domain-containing protein [Candidatus Cloacimonadota bacterium]